MFAPALETENGNFCPVVQAFVRAMFDGLHGLTFERRAVEMDEIAEDIRAMQLDPVMTEAAGRRLWTSAGMGLRETFIGRKGATLEEVLDDYAVVIEGKMA